MAVPARPVSGAPIDSAWGGVAHDTAVAQDVQTGKVTMTLAASAAEVSQAVTFPRPFASAPTVTLGTTAAGGTAGRCVVARISSVSATTFTATLQCATGGASASVTQDIYWIAVGPRA